MEGMITARILGFKEGLRVLENVDMIRIVSSNYNLLILKDYMPVIGEIKGNVELVSGDTTASFENITGYYMHSHNEFEVLITGE